MPAAALVNCCRSLGSGIIAKEVPKPATLKVLLAAIRVTLLLAKLASRPAGICFTPGSKIKSQWISSEHKRTLLALQISATLSSSALVNTEPTGFIGLQRMNNLHLGSAALASSASKSNV